LTKYYFVKNKFTLICLFKIWWQNSIYCSKHYDGNKS